MKKHPSRPRRFIDALESSEQETGTGNEKGMHRVRFLAAKEDISLALEEGWPVKKIWRQLVKQERVDCTYSTFTYHVKKHFDNKEKTREPAVKNPPKVVVKDDQPRTFKHNPNRDEKDYI